MTCDVPVECVTGGDLTAQKRAGQSREQVKRGCVGQSACAQFLLLTSHTNFCSFLCDHAIHLPSASTEHRHPLNRCCSPVHTASLPRWSLPHRAWQTGVPAGGTRAPAPRVAVALRKAQLPGRGRLSCPPEPHQHQLPGCFDACTRL